MKRRFFIFVLAAALLAVFVYSYTRRPAPLPTEEGILSVYTSIYPLAFVAQAVAGDYARVQTVLPPGAEPHEFELSPQHVVDVQRADLFIYNGADLDAWAERLASQIGTVPAIDMAQAIQSKGITLRIAEEEEEASAVDPHFWLDFSLLKQQAQVISQALANIDQEHAATFQTNADGFAAKIDQLDQQYQVGLASCSLRKIVVTHDAFEYVADRYRFQTIPISGISPQDQPSARELGELASLVRREGINSIFLETLASPKLAQTLAQETGVQTRVLNPLEGLSRDQIAAGDDYVSVMEENLEQLRLAMNCK